MIRWGGVVTIVALASLAAIPFLIWALKSDHVLNILIVDKTVPDTNYREHATLIWTLNHLKAVPAGLSRPWKIERDYVGTDPTKTDENGAPVSKRLSLDDLSPHNLVMLIDSYGVYRDDLTDKKPEGWSPDYSEYLVGGFDSREAEALRQYVRNGGCLSGEFSTFASPTHGAARKQLEKLFGVAWTEWSGRYFKDLADISEVPAWTRRHYKKQYGQEWDFRGAGWVFANEDTRVTVLKSGEDTFARELEIVIARADDPLMEDVQDRTPYYYIFDIVKPAAGTEVLANYRFLLTESGRKKLADNHIPAGFPAIIVASRAPLVVYAAGDFSDTFMNPGIYFVSGKNTLMQMVSDYSLRKSQASFFWGFYVPYTSNILVTAAELRRNQ